MRKIFIICEGKSEEKYIQGLRAILVNQCAVDDVLIIPECFCGGETFPDLKNNIKKKIKEIKTDGLTSSDGIYIWLDKDVFLRKYIDKFEELEIEIKKIKIPVNLRFLFNKMNFEDFLILHYTEQEILALQSKLNHKNHFIKPLIAEKYEPIYKTVIKDYSKGNLPDDFILDLEKIKLCVRNIEDKNYNFESEIKEILDIVIQKCEE